MSKVKATVHRCEWFVEGQIASMDTEEIELDRSEDLEKMQKIVGGLIAITTHKGKDLVVDDEGIIKGLPLNNWAKRQGLNLCGTVIEVHGELD